MPNEAVAALTEKEKEALKLVYERLTSKQIGRELGISPLSVNKRLDSARVKLGAPTRVDAARIWARHHYGESFPGPPFTVPETSGLDDPTGADAPIDHQRQIGARLDPARIGPLGRTLIIIAGAAVMILLLLVILAVAREVFALLEAFLGAPRGLTS